MKKLMMAMAVMAAAVALAAPKATRKAAADGDEVTTGRAAKVDISQEPKLGQQACLGAPSVAGNTLLGQCYKKPRQWIVLETKYETYGSEKSKFLDQLTFTWHVILDTASAKENKGNKEKLAPYSYFTTTTTYFNIPQGSHAASVVLPPSYLERYGEPKAVGIVISNENGDILGGGTVSEVRGIKPDSEFWNDQTVMNATAGDGGPMIERRQGLVDRSKTIWALVNPNDYEATLQ